MNKHTVRVYECNLKRKPDNKKEGYIYSDISSGIQRAEHRQLSLYELMEYATNGAVFQVGELAKSEPTPSEKRELRELREMNEFKQYEELKGSIESRPKPLHETTLIVIDIDNDLGNVSPKELIDFIEPSCYYYTFSHQTYSDDLGTLQNALRVVFELNKPVSKGLAMYIENAICNKILQQFPFITAHKGEVVGLLSKSFIFGSRNKDYRVLNRDPLMIENYEKDFAIDQDIKDLIRATKINQNNALDNNELVDMAKFLSNKGVYLDDYKKWVGINLGLFHSASLGLISDELALEVVMTLDQHRQDEKYYLKFKTDKQVANPATVASFIKLAMDQGYKRKHFNTTKKVEIKTKVDPLEVNTYLSINDALTILNDDGKRILVDSATGTGKTYSFIEALKIYLRENPETVCYFAMPTRALSTQPTKIYGLGIPLMNKVTPKRAYESAIATAGVPLVVGTSDKAKMFSDTFKHKKLIVIADEAHKEVLDYGYRPEAVRGLFNLRNASNVSKFIGLSGTPQEIDLGQYDKVIKVKQGLKRDVFGEFDIVTYDKSSLYAECATELITQEVEGGNKVLAFINNKATIKTIQKLLQKMGIKASTVASKENLSQSKTYRYIMENERFPEDTQVLLATTVIADGINIKNENQNYVCMIVPHYQLSPLFNATTIKQASNRFRNPYKKLVIPYFIANNVLADEKRANETRLFNFEWKYQNLVDTATGIAKYTENRFKNSINEYNPSIIEQISGMYYHHKKFKETLSKFDLKQALLEESKKNARLTSYDNNMVNKLDEIREKLFRVDTRVIRQRTSEAQEKYYQYFPYAFIKQLERTLESNAKLTSHALYTESKTDKDAIGYLYQEIKTAESLSEYEKKENVSELLTEYLYEGYYIERQEGKRNGIFLNTIESRLCKDHLKTLPDLIDHCTYDEAIHLLKWVRRPSDYHAFKKSIKNLIQWNRLQDTKKNTPTKLVVNLLSKAFQYDSRHTATERSEAFKSISKKLKSKVDTKDIEEIYNSYFVSDEDPQARKKDKRFRTNYRNINIYDIADKFELDTKVIERIYYSMGGNSKALNKYKKLEAVR